MNTIGNYFIRKKEDLILWEEYLIYSVMFGENNKIVEDICKLLDN